jgi:hypothetical protein
MVLDWHCAGQETRFGRHAADRVSVRRAARRVPVPDEWLGFAMLADARRIAHMLAHAPIEQVTTYMTETFPSLLKRGEVAYWREKGE